MYSYLAFGLKISSQIPLPGMVEVDDSKKNDVTIIRDKINSPPKEYLNSQKSRILKWEGYGQVKISEGKEIIVDAFNDQIIPFILGPVMTVLLHQRGFLVLHGSCVKFENEAVAFLGHRGFGKSTTAINLYVKGYPLITDDLLVIKFDKNDKPVVYPGYPHVRLNEDILSDIKEKTNILTPIRTIVGKSFCDASKGFTTKPMKLKRFYLLNKGDDVQIYPLKVKDNLLDIIRHSLANRIFKDDEQADNLIQCAKLINNVPSKGLKVSHDDKNISKLVKIIEDDLLLNSNKKK